jgi:hypothetical protein
MPTACRIQSLALLVCLAAAPVAHAQQQRPASPAPAPDPGAELKALKRQVAAMQKAVTTLRAQLDAQTAANASLQSTVESLRRDVDGAQRGVRAMQNNSILDLNGYVRFDISSGYPTIVFDGVNVQVVNGTGATQTTNGLGNLIVGYNRPRTTDPVCSTGPFPTQAECAARGGVWARSHKSGSHNIVAGDFNAYSSWGGVVFGLENATTAPYAGVLGGAGNRAFGDLSSVAGGSLNVASGMYGSVSGGLSNAASGAFGTVGGGNARAAAAPYNWAAGALTQDR